MLAVISPVAIGAFTHQSARSQCSSVHTSRLLALVAREHFRAEACGVGSASIEKASSIVTGEGERGRGQCSGGKRLHTAELKRPSPSVSSLVGSVHLKYSISDRYTGLREPDKFDQVRKRTVPRTIRSYIHTETSTMRGRLDFEILDFEW